MSEPAVSTEEGGSWGVAGTLKRGEQTDKSAHGRELPDSVLLSLTDTLAVLGGRQIKHLYSYRRKCTCG